MGLRFYHVNGTRVTRRSPDGTERDRLFSDLEKVFRRQRERIKIRLGLIVKHRDWSAEYRNRKDHGSDDSANRIEE